MKEKAKIKKLIQEKKYFEAENLINSVINKIPKDNEFNFLHGIIKANQKKYIQTKNLFEKFLTDSQSILMEI